jgi:L-threonylcarbamoyladenylate synthase
VEPSALYGRLLRAYWPGPLTIVSRTKNEQGTVGVRMPDHAFLRALIEAVGEPLAATSANPAGVAPDVSAAADFSDLAQRPDFAVRGCCGEGAASTVVSLLDDEVGILRRGAISAEAILALVDETD